MTTSNQSKIEKVGKHEIEIQFKIVDLQITPRLGLFCPTEIRVFTEIEYALDIPILKGSEGKKDEIGYEWHKSYSGLGEPSQGKTHPCRRVYHVKDKMYKILLQEEDNLEKILKDIAHIIIQPRGESRISIHDNSDSRCNDEPKIKISYENGLEDKILRI